MVVSGKQLVLLPVKDALRLSCQEAGGDITHISFHTSNLTCKE